MKRMVKRNGTLLHLKTGIARGRPAGGGGGSQTGAKSSAEWPPIILEGALVDALKKENLCVFVSQKMRFPEKHVTGGKPTNGTSEISPLRLAGCCPRWNGLGLRKRQRGFSEESSRGGGGGCLSLYRALLLWSDGSLALVKKIGGDLIETRQLAEKPQQSKGDVVN